MCSRVRLLPQVVQLQCTTTWLVCDQRWLGLWDAREVHKGRFDATRVGVFAGYGCSASSAYMRVDILELLEQLRWESVGLQCKDMRGCCTPWYRRALLRCYLRRCYLHAFDVQGACCVLSWCWARQWFCFTASHVMSRHTCYV